MPTTAAHVTLAPGVVSTVTLSEDFQVVDVINVSGASEIYCRSDGPNPTVKGDDCDVVCAGAGAFTTIGAPGRTTVVKLIAASATDVSVVGRSY